jgi:phage tail sheath protein FI
MGFQVSPGVEVKEIDLTNVIPAVSTSIGGYSGYFRWGPVNEINLVSSEKELADIFGTPDAAHTQSFLTAASFLKYGSALKVVRAGNAALKNAYAGSYETPFGGIESITFGTPPTEFENLSAAVILAVSQASGGAGTDAVLTPSYSPFAATGFVAATAIYEVDALTGTLAAGDYSTTIDTQTLAFSSDGSLLTVTTNVTGVDGTVASFSVDELATYPLTLTWDTSTPAASVITDVVLASGSIPDGSYTLAIPGATGGDLAFTSASDVLTITTNTVSYDGSTTLPATAIDLVVTTTTAVTVTPTYAQENAVADGDVLNLVSSVDSQPFAVTYDAVNGNSVALGNFSPESTFGVTSLEATNALNVVVGSFTISYSVSQINVPDPGEDYDIPTITVSVNGTDVDQGGLLNIDEAERLSNSPAFIPNAEDFETQTALPGLFFARYAGEVGNSLQVTIIDVGSFGLGDGLASSFDSAPEAGSIHILVTHNGEEVEAWSDVSTTPGAKLANGTNNYFADVINARSNWFYVARPLQASAAGTYIFQGGADWDGVLVEGDLTGEGQGLELFRDVETVDVNLLFSMADVSTDLPIGQAVQSIAVDRKDCVAFVSPTIASSTIGTATVRLAAVTTQIDKLTRDTDGSYAVYDSTALYVYNKYADTYSWIPAAGHMAGLCAKTDDLAEPWFSPAGLNRGGLRGVTKLGFNPNKSQRDTLYKKGVNPIANFPGNGIVLFGDKTVQAKPSAFDRINVRRLFIVLEKAIATAAKYQLFELNDEFTRAMFRNMTEPFLRDVKGRRGITDFLVVCDETNNTGDVIDTNRFVADIYIKPARSINFITLNFIATRTGVDFSEIVGK